MANATNAYLPKALVAPQLTHPVHSAAAALGGKISETTVRMPITNVLNDGDYSGKMGYSIHNGYSGNMGY